MIILDVRRVAGRVSGWWGSDGSATRDLWHPIPRGLCLRMESSVHNGDARTLRRQGNDHNSEVLGDEYQKPPWSERAQRSTAVYVCSKLL